MTKRMHGDPTAEKDLLCLMMTTPHLVAEAAELVPASAFTGEKGKMTYEAILAVASRGQVVDISSISDELQSSGNLKKVGGRATIAGLSCRGTNEAYFNHLCQRIRLHAAIRDMAMVATEAIDAAQNIRPEEQPVYEAIDTLQSKLSDIVSRGRPDDVGYSNPDAVSTAERLIQPPEAKGQGVPSGYNDLDDLLRGFRAGQLVLLAARSRVGKTSLACDIIRQVASQGYTVVFFSLEMTRSEIWERMVCGQAGVSLHALKSRQALPAEATALRTAAAEIASNYIVVKDSPDVTPLSMRGFCRKVQHKQGLGLVVVDYLQCIKSGKDKHNRYEAVSEVSRQLKVMARTLNVPVIALAQLNRTAEQEEPKLSHLRESGSLEQDADVVMLLNRPHIFDSNADATLATLDIAKHRNGPCQIINLNFDADSVSFKNRLPKVEDFTKVSQDSPVAPPRRKSSGWWENNAYD
jgi:replicative DNA helicase